jgi:myosin heavy subunit
MKKADIRTQATLNIHEIRMNEIKAAEPEKYGKTEASAKAYREIKEGLFRADIAAEIKRLNARINRKAAFKRATDNVNAINAACDKRDATAMTDDQKAKAREIEVENYVARIEEIKALKQIIARKEYENDRLMEANNAGAGQLNELREDLRKARNLATNLATQKEALADRLEDISENFDEVKGNYEALARNYEELKKDRDIEVEDLKRQVELFKRLADAKAETNKGLVNEVKDCERAIADLKGYKRVAEEKVEELRTVDFNPLKFGIAPSGRKAEIFDEILDAITSTEFEILKVKVNARAIEIIKADFAERGIEIEW